MNRPTGAVLLCLVSGALFGVSTPVAKALLDVTSPLVLAAMLYLGAALATAPFALRRIETLSTLDARNRRQLLLAILCGGVIGPIAMLTALGYASATSIALWLSLESVATTLLAWGWYREHIHRRTLIALLLVVIASGVLAPLEVAAPLAVLWIVIACVAWGIDNNATAVIDGLDAVQTTFAKGLVAGIVNLLLALAIEPSGTLFDGGAATLAAGLCLGAASYGLSIVLYIQGAQQLGASRSQLLFSSAPLWGVGLAWGWLGESIGWVHGLAVLLMGAAAVLLHGERHAHWHRHEPQQHRHWHRHDDAHHDADEALHQQASHPRLWFGWHSHPHGHAATAHAHPHQADLHHRHIHTEASPDTQEPARGTTSVSG